MSAAGRSTAVLAARGLSVGYGGRHPTVVLSDVNAELQGGPLRGAAGAERVGQIDAVEDAGGGCSARWPVRCCWMGWTSRS